jgi:uncharacterized membrane protein
MADALYALLNTLGYSHPVHAIVVHMPIGLAVGALVFALVALIWKQAGAEALRRREAVQTPGDPVIR